MKVRNRKTVRHLSWKTFCANKTRNIVAALAIALTAMMFTALFTIVITMNYSFEQQTMRQVGGYSHGGFKRLTKEQVTELRDDDLIKESGATFLFTSPTEAPFNKIWAEMRYAEDNYAKFCWSEPTEGRMPKSGKEIAVDTTILEELGIPAKLGTEVTLTFPLGNEQVTDTFTLSGYWEADPALPAHMMWLSEEYVLSEIAKVPRDVQEMNGIGNWYLDMVFADSKDINGKLEQIAENHGYTVGDKTEGKQLSVGINWAYTSTHAETADAQSVSSVAGALVLMLLTGYLIIYNVFQISVAGDIRFYGLLKTIGTTGRQIQRMVRYQALILSVIGIPIGLLFGYVVGNLLVPVLMANLIEISVHRTVNPLIFIGAALFTLVTVFISCFLPARRASKVSPIEAVRYTEQTGTKKKQKKSRQGNRIFRMAMANLMRNRLKTILVVLSLALSVVMLNGVYGFTKGFSMDGFLKKFVISDFLVANADQFSNGGGREAVSRNLVDNLINQDGFEDGGYVRKLNEYSVCKTTKEKWLYWMMEYQRFSEDEIDKEVLEMPDDASMDIEETILVLDDYTLSHLEILEGSLDKWKEPGSIIQLIVTDDYGQPDWSDAVFDTGDTITQVFSDDYTIDEDGFNEILNSQTEEEYTIIATAMIPGVMTERWYGHPKYAMSEEALPEFMRKYLIDMIYMADFDEEGTIGAEKFIQNYTENIEPEMSYESKQKFAGNYNQLQTTFWLVGGSLSFIIGLVGVLNFVNGELTAIISRRRELAMLQSIGMTGKQMKKMLILEGVLTGAFALVIASVLNLGVYFGMMPAIENLFWYFKQNFTMTMIFAAVPVFLLLGIGVPVLAYTRAERKSVVERLRESDV